MDAFTADHKFDFVGRNEGIVSQVHQRQKCGILGLATATLNPSMFSSIMARTTLAGNFRLIIQNGAVAQLGERLNGIQEVRGSIPLGSTNQTKIPNLIRSTSLCEINPKAATSFCFFPI